MLDLPPQIVCIAQAVYGEARGEKELGQRAVAHVIINRTKSGRFASIPCAVINQRGQFLFPRNKPNGINWIRAMKIARDPGVDPTSGSLYFHNRSVRPKWRYKVNIRIGNHIFYK